mmetsp:Transcript_7549/g.17831  ORF Transcript_7549/g.17831 Transcript_7549/m.17831 type:complete len:383 (+) Transcript_7549:34-1182(+)
MGNTGSCSSVDNPETASERTQRSFPSPACRDLYYASADGDVPRVKVALEHGASVSSTDALGHTSLMMAAFGGHLDVARVLMSYSAAVNAATRDGRATALHLAAASGSFAMCRLLLTNGALVDAGLRSGAGRAPLQLAAQNGHTDCVRQLLSSQASVNHRDEVGSTALISAGRFGHLLVVEVLLRTGDGIDVNHVDKTGRSLFTEAFHRMHEGNSGPWWTVVNNLVRMNVSPDNVDEDGHTPLSMFVDRGQREYARAVVKLGADPNVPVPALTGGHVIFGARSPDVCKVLLECQASVNLRNAAGLSPLEFYIRERNSDVCDVLLACKANVNTQIMMEAGFEGLGHRTRHALLQRMKSADGVVPPQIPSWSAAFVPQPRASAFR